MSVVFEESGAGDTYQIYVHVGRGIYMDDILTYYFNFHFYYSTTYYYD